MFGFGSGIKNLGDLRRVLEELDHLKDEVPVFIAQQPNWPFEYSISGIAVVEPRTCAYPDDDKNAHDHSACEDATAEINAGPDEGYRIYFAEGSQLGYLPGAAREEIGW